MPTFQMNCQPVNSDVIMAILLLLHFTPGSWKKKKKVQKPSRPKGPVAHTRKKRISKWQLHTPYYHSYRRQSLGSPSLDFSRVKSDPEEIPVHGMPIVPMYCSRGMTQSPGPPVDHSSSSRGFRHDVSRYLDDTAVCKSASLI